MFELAASDWGAPPSPISWDHGRKGVRTASLLFHSRDCGCDKLLSEATRTPLKKTHTVLSTGPDVQQVFHEVQLSDYMNLCLLSWGSF